MMRTGRYELAVVLAGALAAAGCGSHANHAARQPRLPGPLAQQLAQRSDDVAQKLAAGDSCGAQASARGLEAATAASIGEVPRPLRAPLQHATSDLATRIVCVPPKPPPKKHEEHRKKGKH